MTWPALPRHRGHRGRGGRSRRVAQDARAAGTSNNDYISTRASVQQHLESLAAASATLTQDFGGWRTPWGEINRFQRLNGDIAQPFNDNEPSLAVGFASDPRGYSKALPLGTWSSFPFLTT